MRILWRYLLGLLFCGWWVFAGTARAQTVMVDGSQTNQLIEGFGANLNYEGWTNNDLKPVIDALVDQANLTLFRVIFSNSDWEGTNDNSDPDVMNWDYYNTIYSSPRFQQLWGVMAYLNQKGITNGAIFNFQGPGPAWMGSPTLTPGYEDEWAEMIASLLYYARNTENLQFNLVEPDNEPDYPFEGIDTDGSAQYVTMLHDLAVKLDTNGMSDIRFVAPDLAYTDTNFMAAIMDDPVVMAKLAHFGLHSYSPEGVGSDGISDFIQQSPYPDITFWMTEFNVWCAPCQAGQLGDYDWSYCEGTAQYLFAHLANGASGGMVWEAYDSQYYITTTQSGTQWSFWGVFGVDDTNAVDKTYTARQNFYTLSQITKFVLPGSYLIGLSGNSSPFAQLLAFWQPDTSNFTLTGVNSDTGPDPLAVSLASLPAIQSLQFYYTDASSNLAQLADVPVTNGANFTAMIPANCVFTLVGQTAMTASITAPAAGAQFTAPATIAVQALVSNSIGVVSQVDFFSGTNNIGTLTAPPYGMVWSNVPPGAYTLTASVSNSAGGGVVSLPVNVTVVGPLAQITVVPSNVTLVPFGTQSFYAVGADALGTVFDSQPPFVWSATGGTISPDGWFTAGSNIGGAFTVSAGNNSIVGSASVSVLLDNLAPAGTGYTWYSMSNSSANSPRAAAPGINDGNLTTDVPLRPDGKEESSEVWEAAGVVWNSPQTINLVAYINGSYDPSDDGVFAASFTLQFSPDGSTWTNAAPEWSVAPAYSYNSAASADVSFNFTGGEITVEGVRCAGLVHTSNTVQNSWIAFARELEADAAPALPGLSASLTNNGIVISWSGLATNFLLETATNPAPPYVWSTVTNVPQPAAGNQQQVIISPTARRQLFRLRQPL